MLQLGDAEEFSQALGFQSLDPFFSGVSQQSPCFTIIEQDGGDKRLVQLELVREAYGVPPPDLV